MTWDQKKPCCPLLWFPFPPDTGHLLRCKLFGLLIDWIRPLLCQAYGEREKTLGKVYDFVHRNNLPVCIFRLWTRASLNFGELNLYLPPRLKYTLQRGRMSPITAEENATLIQVFKCFCLFYVSGLCCVSCNCTRKGDIFLLFQFFVNVLFCDKVTVMLEYMFCQVKSVIMLRSVVIFLKLSVAKILTP